MKIIMESKTKKQTKISGNKEVTKLSKIGEWFKSGQSIGCVYDMKAILR